MSRSDVVASFRRGIKLQIQRLIPWKSYDTTAWPAKTFSHRRALRTSKNGLPDRHPHLWPWREAGAPFEEDQLVGVRMAATAEIFSVWPLSGRIACVAPSFHLRTMFCPLYGQRAVERRAVVRISPLLEIFCTSSSWWKDNGTSCWQDNRTCKFGYSILDKKFLHWDICLP